MQDLNGKVFLITGATDGLGKEVGRRLSRRGATLLLHGRNGQKGAELLAELKRESGNNRLFFYRADLSSLAEVRDMCLLIRREQPELHGLVNNAAVGGGPKGTGSRELSRDGYELRFAVNYLAHFVLTENLPPLLIRSAPARIVHVSSIGQSKLDFSDLMLERNWDSFRAYCCSKLAQIIYSFESARRLNDTGVTVNCLHPASLMDTSMVSDFFGYSTSTVSDGADVVEHVLLSPETALLTGTYFNRMRPATANLQAYDQAAAQQLWKHSVALSRPFLLPGIG